jgi:hypothetical protein
MLKNTTRVKIPKMYWEKVATLDLNEETGLYEAVAEKGFIFPTIKAYKGEAKGHKGIWEIIRYVAVDELAVKAEAEEFKVKLVEDLVKPLAPVKEIEVVVEEEIIQPEFNIDVERSITDGLSIKELWVIGKKLGFKGCTRWSKSKLVEEITKKEVEALA